MAGSGEHLKALLRSHASGDDASFYAVARQVAAQEARRGHHKLAGELKSVIDAAKQERPPQNVTSIARPRGDLAELIEVSIPEVSIKDLVLPAEVNSQVKQVLFEQRQRKSLLDHGYFPVHRLLLEGPPGTGKTMTALVIARELNLPLLTVRLDSLLSKYLGETAGKLRIVFDAVAAQRAVYLFDEFDALGAHRTGNDVGEARRILNSFLVFLEQASAESIVIAATNHRSILDRALFRRFDMVLTFDLPDIKSATTVMKMRLGKMAKGIHWFPLSEYMVGLSHADLVKAAESAAKMSIMRQDPIVHSEDLISALKNRRSASLG